MKKYLVLFLLVTTLLNAASFDCKKASTKIDKTICNDPNLSNLDSLLGDTYKELKVMIVKKELSKKDVKSLKSLFINTQRKWLKNRNKSCKRYDEIELKSCLDDHYSQRIQKLKVFTTDGSFVYRSYENIRYIYNHIPYIQNSFKELLDKKEYTNFLEEYNRWEESYEVCIDKYGVMQEECTLGVAKKKTAYYENLLESYKNIKYLFEDGAVTQIERSTKSYLKSYDDENEACYSYKYYPKSEYKKLFHGDAKLLKQLAFKIPHDMNNLKNCRADDSRFHLEKIEKISFISKNILVFMRDESSYFGGAHGDYESTYYTFDRNSAEQISWEDIFGKKKKLYDFIMKKMHHIVMHTESYKESKYYAMATSHYYITKDGIIVKFGIYEIGSYDQREPSFLIPLKLLKKTLSKEKYAYYFGEDKSLQLKATYKSQQ